MIKNIKIEKFKNISSINLDLEAVNVLVGTNNAGKSSILQAIQFSVSIAQTTTLIPNVKWDRKKNYLSTSLSPEQLIYTPTTDVYSLSNSGRLTTKDEDKIKISFLDDSGQSTFVEVKKGKNKNIAVKIDNEILGEKLRDISNPFSIYAPGLAGISINEEFRNRGMINRATARGNANNYFRNILLELEKEEKKWNKFIEDFNYIFPDINIEIIFDKNNDEYIQVFSIKGRERNPIETSGTGVLQTIQILSYVNLYKPKILILDEPDSHLHPNNQILLMRKLYQLAEEDGFQIIISTHSRHVIYALQDNARFNWIDNGGIKDAKFNLIKVLAEIGALDKGDMLKNENIKLIIISEDSDKKYLSQIIKSSGFSDEDFDIWGYNGVGNINAANLLAKFIKDSAPKVKIVLHRDRDILSDEEIDSIKDKLDSSIQDLFITDGYDIESHYLKKEVISSMIPSLPLNEAQLIIDDAIKESKDTSIDKIIDSLGYSKKGKASDNLSFANENYNNNKFRWTYSKCAMKIVRNKINDLGFKLDYNKSFIELKSEFFSKLYNEINSN